MKCDGDIAPFCIGEWGRSRRLLDVGNGKPRRNVLDIGCRQVVAAKKICDETLRLPKRTAQAQRKRISYLASEPQELGAPPKSGTPERLKKMTNTTPATNPPICAHQAVPSFTPL